MGASNCACDFYELSQSNSVNNLFSAKKKGNLQEKEKSSVKSQSFSSQDEALSDDILTARCELLSEKFVTST